VSELTPEQQGQIEGPAGEVEAIEFMVNHGGGVKILVVPPGGTKDKAFYVACLFGKRVSWINSDETLKAIRDVMFKMVGDVLTAAAKQQQDVLFTDDHFTEGFLHHPNRDQIGKLAADAIVQDQAEMEDGDDEVAHV
jgi:hypothetical protein